MLINNIPTKTPVEISDHEDWYNSIVSLAEKKKITLKERDENHTKMVDEAEKSIEEARERARKLEQASKELQERESLRKMLHEKLALQREEKLAQISFQLEEINRAKELVSDFVS